MRLLWFTTLLAVVLVIIAVINVNNKDFLDAHLLQEQQQYLDHHRRLQLRPLVVVIAILAYITGVINIFERASCRLLSRGNCICNERTLQNFLNSGSLSGNICSDTTLAISSQSIDLTGLEFTLGCDFALRLFDEVDYRSCKIQSQVERAFVGAPVSANFERLDFIVDTSLPASSFFDISGGSANFVETNFIGGFSSTTEGGAMRVSNTETVVTMGLHVLFDGNGASTNGGALAILDGASVESQTAGAYRDNVSSGDGGAIYVANGASLNIVFDGLFLGNTATGNGGALAVVSDATAVIGTSSRFFEGNVAALSGNNIYVDSGSSSASVSCEADMFVPVGFCGGEFGIEGNTNCQVNGVLDSATSSECDSNRVDSLFER
mmetsp:Transcript_14643/g.22307  ORF Transcript_14643/g.22307 Transcript_14643/m.22307 type:complete len:379 (+) Transcript_14643:67-1203(+)|eukprot:CAMPEP_0118673340 /NCGR_PEP_ID=MMETSP0800-20121206/263_1 /TAXON_ID=210618 ORGANISM="Striatella unipunctata, Strain CCMP2910" /NCGR_SAMPLE_ID=MMETSP0800 /ASSEMBLY_ACC=CAM_ASM_000638 /LENGTH=378 /DNA_ID=CAMNT_0006568383 /DNA_START=28 /DNA_END=1164 /DNA_ORIENTATION=+